MLYVNNLRLKQPYFSGIQFTGKNFEEVEAWGKMNTLRGIMCIRVETKNGIAIARKDDWIVRDSEGWFSVFRLDEFNRMFEGV